jgi:hypothetical protein
MHSRMNIGELLLGNVIKVVTLGEGTTLVSGQAASNISPMDSEVYVVSQT